MDIVHKDLIPLLEIDFAISDARSLYERRRRPLFMTNPWWESTNRNLLITHLCKLYEFSVKFNLPYLNVIRFNNRTPYHLHPAGRTIVREISQSIGSTTLRAHFRDLSKQFKGSWLDLFEMEERFWAVQHGMTGQVIDSSGAITRLANKRAYTLWESLDAIRQIAKSKQLSYQDFFDYTLFHTKPCNAYKLTTSIGSATARHSVTIQATMPQILAHPAFQGREDVTKSTDWLSKLGFPNANLLGGTIPLGFYLAHEHAGSGGKLEDVTDIAPSGQYRTRDGSTFIGDFWFRGAKNPWLVVQVNESNFEKVDPDSWYNPSKYNSLPTIKELLAVDPAGPWTKVWDAKTGRAISPQAGRISLKMG